MIEQIKDQIKDSIYAVKTTIRKIYLDIKSIIYWIPIIKNDRWWDYYFFDILVLYKLKHMREGFLTKGVSVESENIAHELSSVIRELEILIQNDSFEEDSKLRKNIYTYIGNHSNSWWD